MCSRQDNLSSNEYAVLENLAFGSQGTGPEPCTRSYHVVIHEKFNENSISWNQRTHFSHLGLYSVILAVIPLSLPFPIIFAASYWQLLAGGHLLRRRDYNAARF
jgi:hypothetical protein